MERKITIILLILLSISVGYIWLKQEPVNYDYLKTEHTRLRNELKELSKDLKTQDYEINRLKTAMAKSDSTILNASRPELDSLYTDFFDRVRLP